MAHSINVQANLGLTVPKESDRPEISFITEDIDVVEWKGDILALGVTEKDMEKDENSEFKNSLLRRLDLQLGGLLSKATSEEDLNGKAGQSLVLRLPDGLIGSKRVGLFGLAAAALPAVAYRSLGEAVAAVAKSSQAASAAIALASSEDIPAELKPSIAAAIATGVTLGTFVDNRFKSESEKSTCRSVYIIGLGSGHANDDKLKRAERVSAGIILARKLVNAPANVLTPEALAKEAKRIASGSDYLTARILDAEQCKELKMGAFLGVTAASAKPPYFIDLFYSTPTKERKIRLALVGKGLTFDSGGYNLKTGANSRIELMKNDMAGAAALLGVAEALGQMTIFGVQIHFIIAACENMISGNGMRPGDILTASNGKTIEVNNTDAEGRLTLADAFVYACNQGVDKMVDLATLTGASITALGPSVAGVFTPSDDMAKEVLGASEVSGEKLWRMPMEESYWDSMKSELADMKNTGPSQGGAITAALFLKQFVDEKVKWLHIDIAGPVMDEKNLATGFGVSTMVEWVLCHGRVAAE